MHIQSFQSKISAVDIDNCLFFDSDQGSNLIVALASSLICEASNVTLISPFSKELSARKVAQIKSYGLLPESVFEKLEVVNLKQNWKESKQSLGYDYLLKDLLRFIENSSSDHIILHRIEQFFEIQDRKKIEDFISSLVNRCRDLGKKILITLYLPHVNAGFIRDQVEKHIDMEVKVEKSMQETHAFEIEITYSIVSATHEKYLFRQVGEGNFNIEIKPQELQYKNVPSLEEKKKEPTILLVSEQGLTSKRLSYLLRYTDCKLKVVSSDTSSLISELLSKPDLILFSENSNVSFDITALIHEHDLPLVMISSKTQTRKLDKLKAIRQGCLDLLEKDYAFEDLLLIIERTINKNVYNFDINNEVGEHNISCHDEFIKRINWLVEKNCYFTVFNIFLDPKEEQSLEQLNCRPYDRYSYDSSTSLLRYLAVNMLSHDAGFIESIVRQALPGASMDSYQEAFEFSLEAASA